VIPIPNNLLPQMSVLAGSSESITNAPLEIFNDARIEFLSELSRRLLANSFAKTLPDVVTFAFWCRRSNLTKMRNSYLQNDVLRMGLGLTFHICPANVPINFAFSMAFGLLSGNSCVLRLPSKATPTVDVLVNEISSQLDEHQFGDLREALTLLRFERDDEISSYWMSVADGRVVWGGDATVAHMRKFPTKSRSREVAFPDRYSLCVIDPKSVNNMQEKRLKQFCNDLFNDIYLMDQAACSSPQLIAWIGEQEDVLDAQARMWPEVVKIAELKYSIQAVNVIDKFVQACRSSITDPHVVAIERNGNVLYRVSLNGVDLNQDKCRGYFGTVHEVVLTELNELAPIINERYQTLTIEGIEMGVVRNWITRNRLRGVDRVVPVGKALNMDVVWDGYDIVSSLSRVIAI
jgi:hypothetical protein